MAFVYQCNQNVTFECHLSISCSWLVEWLILQCFIHTYWPYCNLTSTVAVQGYHIWCRGAWYTSDATFRKTFYGTYTTNGTLQHL